MSIIFLFPIFTNMFISQSFIFLYTRRSNLKTSGAQSPPIRLCQQSQLVMTPVNMNTKVMRAVIIFRIPRGRLKSFGSFMALRSGKTKAIPSYENNAVPKLKAILGRLVIKLRSSVEGIPSVKATVRVAATPKIRQRLPIFDTGAIWCKPVNKDGTITKGIQNNMVKD
ncbi:hypothetical protein GQX74_008231 [Glossina fuscipes]|nr:hypothetical protein GQX74_008231 [Glossina fuscipes]